MKKSLKYFASVIIISGLFFVPVLGNAQDNGDSVNDNNIQNPVKEEPISQAEEEAMEELYEISVFNLQTDMQNEQQALQTFSNIMKTILDTENSIIRNIR